MKDNNQHIDNIIQQKANNHPIFFDENNWDKMESLLDTHLPIAHTGGSIVAKTSFFKKIASLFLPVVATVGLGYLVWNANVNQSITTDVLNAQPVSPQSLTHENTSHTTGIEKAIDSPSSMATVKEANSLNLNKKGLEKIAAKKEVSIEKTSNNSKQNKSVEKIAEQQEANKQLSSLKAKTSQIEQRDFNNSKAKVSTNIAQSIFAKPVQSTPTTLQNSVWNNANTVNKATDFNIANTQNVSQNKITNTNSPIATNTQTFENTTDNQAYIFSNPDLLNKQVEENITNKLSDKIMTKQLVMPLLPKEGLVELDGPLALDGKAFPKLFKRKFKISLVAGLNNRIQLYDNESAIGPLVGLAFSYQLSTKYQLEIRPQYINVEQHLNSSFEHTTTESVVGTAIRTINTSLLHYWQFPMVLKRKIGLDNYFLVGLNPTVIGFLGESRATSIIGATPPTKDFPYTNKAGLQRWDIGLVVGYQETIYKKWKVDIRYTQGIMDISHDNWFKNDKTHVNSDLQVGLVYQLR